MDRKNKLLLKNTIILTIGQVIPKFIALIVLPILTTYMSVEEFGIYELIVSFVSLAIPILTLLIQQGLFRYVLIEKNEENIIQYITTAVISVIALIIMFNILFFIISTCFVKKIYILLLAFYLYAIESIFELFSQIARSLNKNIIYSISIILYSLVNVSILGVFCFWKTLTISNVIIILIVAYIVATIFIFIKLNIKKYIDYRKFNFEKLKEMLKYSIPIIPSSISLWVVGLSDRIIISIMLGATFNGIYAAATKIPNLLGMVTNVFNLAWTEVATIATVEDDIEKYYSEMFSKLFSFSLSALLILILITPLLFKILINDKFIEAYVQIPVLLLAIFINIFVVFFGGIYIGIKETSKVGISSFIGAIINIIINLTLINKLQLFAASISTLISYAVIALYRGSNLKKFLCIQYNLKEIFNGMMFLIISLICFYTGSVLGIIINLVITIIYNLKYNELLEVFFYKMKGFCKK